MGNANAGNIERAKKPIGKLVSLINTERNIGDVNYSLDTSTSFNLKVISYGFPIFIVCYTVLVIISFLYLINIMFMQYYFPEIENEDYKRKRKLLNYYKSLTVASPFKIFELSRYDSEIKEFKIIKSSTKDIFEEQIFEDSNPSKKNKKMAIEDTNGIINSKNIEKHNVFLGLSGFTYLSMAITFTISLFLLLDGFLNTLIYFLFSSTVQINSDYNIPPNNPTINGNCISKISFQDSVNNKTAGYNIYNPFNPYSSATYHFTSLTIMGYVFLIPFFTSIYFKIFKIDNYDLKKSKMIGFVLLFLMFYPVIFTTIGRLSYPRKFNMLNDLKKFIVPYDYSYVDYLNSSYSNKMLYIFMFLSIVFIYLYYYFCHFMVLPNKTIFITIFIVLVFMLVPLLLVFIPFQIIFSEKPQISNNRDIYHYNTIDKINYHISKKESVTNIYQLLIKYNYPCFPASVK